jgi:hypothetical protein
VFSDLERIHARATAEEAEQRNGEFEAKWHIATELPPGGHGGKADYVRFRSKIITRKFAERFTPPMTLNSCT